MQTEYEIKTWHTARTIQGFIYQIVIPAGATHFGWCVQHHTAHYQMKCFLQCKQHGPPCENKLYPSYTEIETNKSHPKYMIKSKRWHSCLSSNKPLLAVIFRPAPGVCFWQVQRVHCTLPHASLVLLLPCLNINFTWRDHSYSTLRQVENTSNVTSMCVAIHSQKTNSEVVLATCDNILLVLRTYMCPGPHTKDCQREREYNGMLCKFSRQTLSRWPGTQI